MRVKRSTTCVSLATVPGRATTSWAEPLIDKLIAEAPLPIQGIQSLPSAKAESTVPTKTLAIKAQASTCQLPGLRTPSVLTSSEPGHTL